MGEAGNGIDALGGYAAIVLAGGAARRLGGAPKPALPVAGRPMLDRVLAAVVDAAPRIVVGPADLSVPAGVQLTREQPPGAGPVAAAAAGLALVPAGPAEMALLAADLPLLTAQAVAVLRHALATGAGPGSAVGAGVRPGAAVYVDAGGRRQNLCGLWQVTALRATLGRLRAERGDLTGAPMWALFEGMEVAEVSWSGTGPPPWFDCDTDADLRTAEEWAR